MITVNTITPEKSLSPLKGDHITLPASDGEVGIRKGHASFVCLLGKGDMFIKENDKTIKTIKINGGVAKVANDEIVVLAEKIEE